MAEVRLVKTDLPPQQRKPIKDAIEELYKRHVTKGSEKKSKNARRADFAQALKTSLDDSFGSYWHVLVGEKLGFACKKRQQTMAAFRVEESMIVIWMSPGIEEPEPAESTEGDAKETAQTEGAKAGEDAAEEKKTDEKKAEGKKAADPVKVLEPTAPEEGSNTEEVIAALRSELAKTEPGVDAQALAQTLRKRLTADFGTIWHVAAGSDFVLEAAENRRNHVLLTWNKTRIVCFQHEQFKGGVTVDWGKLFASLPYLLLIIFCFGYLTLNTLCNEESPDPSQKLRHKIRTNFCERDWENSLQYVGGAALVALFFGRRARRAAAAPATVKTKAD